MLFFLSLVCISRSGLLYPCCCLRKSALGEVAATSLQEGKASCCRSVFLLFLRAKGGGVEWFLQFILGAAP